MMVDRKTEVLVGGLCVVAGIASGVSAETTTNLLNSLVDQGVKHPEVLIIPLVSLLVFGLANPRPFRSALDHLQEK